MRRKHKLLTLAILLMAVGLVLGILGLMLKVEPDFYEVDSADGGQSFEQAARLVTRVQDLKNDIRSKAEWGASFRAEDLNAFFSENLSESSGLRDLLPPGCHSPRVKIDDDRIRIGLRYGSGLWSTVLWIDMRAWLVEDETNVIALELRGLRAGVLPMGCQSLLDSLTEVAHDSNIDVTWYRHEGNPVGIFRFYADQLTPTTQIHTFKVADGALTIGGRTRLDASAGATPPGLSLSGLDPD